MLCQFPSFLEQYTMRVAGHLAECRHFTAALEKNAAQTKKTMSAYIQKFLSATDEDFRSAGDMMEKVVERQKWLEDSYHSLSMASPFTRPIVFMSALDSEILQETIHGYKAQLVFTWETLIYGLIGLFLGIGLWKGICALFSRKPKAAPPAS